MSIFSLYFGDWSDDGHGKYEKCDVIVPDQFTKEILTENYKKNKAGFGFGLGDFARDYDDSTILKDDLEILQKAGFDFESENIGPEETGMWVYIDLSDMLNIAMFFFGHGLPDFNWETHTPHTDGTLIGMWDDEAESGLVGYGLFY